MEHSDFQIGGPFWCGGRRWRCTDVGTRVVVAVSVESAEIVRHSVSDVIRGEEVAERFVSDDPSWHTNGPPYAVVEEVFDEYAQEGCSSSPATDEIR